MNGKDERMKNFPGEATLSDLLKLKTQVDIESFSAKLLEKTVTKKGCFKFNDNSTQNWKIDQLFDLKTNIKYTPITANKKFYGFTLVNSNNLALSARANDGVLMPASNAASYYIRLESPDLLSNPDWQGVSGYSIDIYRMLTAPCGDPPYYVQLQMDIVDSKNEVRTLAESNGTQKNDFVYHQILLETPYHLVWTFAMDKSYKVKCLRILLVGPCVAPVQGECFLAKGEWLIGNVCPEK